jgi:hypothetical protein
MKIHTPSCNQRKVVTAKHTGKPTLFRFHAVDVCQNIRYTSGWTFDTFEAALILMYLPFDIFKV